MKLLLIALIASLTVSCAHAEKRIDKLDFTQSVPTLQHENKIPEDCFDENGIFDENLGHDTLDCGNLPQVK